MEKKQVSLGLTELVLIQLFSQHMNKYRYANDPETVLNHIPENTLKTSCFSFVSQVQASEKKTFMLCDSIALLDISNAL